MRILAIETSCDDTSVAIIEASGALKAPKFRILSNIVSSQIELHAKYGGVVPTLAAREHEKNLIPVFKEAIAKSKVKLDKIDYLAVTHGPGLIPSLLTGVQFAKIISWHTKIPLIPVNHLEGHLYSNWYNPPAGGKKIEFLILNLIVSGGHTQLVLMRASGKYKVLGETLDDVAGEAFDKVARMLDLGYPGGPQISKQAEKGNPKAIDFPRGMIHSKNFNFSFSGLKTAVLYKLKKMKRAEIKKRTPDICASFQEAVVEVLIEKTYKAAVEYKAKTIMISGGVAANVRLREAMKHKARTANFKIPVHFPARELSTDNAAMIAMAAYINLKKIKSKITKQNWKKVKANANLRLT